MKDLKYLMSYSIAFMAFLGISIGGFYNYLAVIYTFVFIPVLEVLVKRSDEKYTEQEKANRLLDPFFDEAYIPVLETNRSCPYRCTFCAWGIGTEKLAKFDEDRILKEIE